MASRKKWNRRLVLAGGVAVAGSYFALRGTSLRRKPREAGTFYRGNAAEPRTLDPSLSSAAPEVEILGDLMVGLIALDPEARPVPGMATHWQTSADGLTWTFFLRQAFWSDGKPVTADDFLFAWRRTLDPATASSYAYFLYGIGNAAQINSGKLPGSALAARALDAHTLEVRLEHPAPYLLEMLAHPATLCQPRHAVQALGKDWTRPGHFVGNGAFLLTEWVPNDHILLVKNPRFYEAEQVTLKKVTYYPTDDYGAALQRFRAGDLDVQDRLPSQQIDWVRTHIPQTINPVPQLTAEFITVNLRRKPFDDFRVRAALNMALNREALTGHITRAGFVPAYAIVPPGIANYPGGNAFDFRTVPYARRLDEARALMRQAGFGDHNRVTASYMIRATMPGMQRAMAAAIQQMLAQVYIDVTIAPNDMQIFYPTIQAHDFDIAQAAWGADFNDAETFLDLFRSNGGDNWGQYSNPAFDGMLNAAQQDRDIASRGAKLAAAEAILLKDQAVMPLYFWVSLNLVWPYVTGWKANAMDTHRSRWVRLNEAARAKQFG